METKFNFKSQVATSREQSERLLALGLKKETADCYFFYCDIAKEWKCTILSSTQVFKDYPTTVIPAWSLHRLWCLLPHSIAIVTHFGQYKAGLDLTMDCYQNVCYLEGVDVPICDMSFFAKDAYESICDAIEWLIKEGYFNKEYLA